MSKIFSGYRSPGARTDEQVQAERGEIESKYIDPQQPKRNLIDEAINKELAQDPDNTIGGAAPVAAPDARTLGVGQGQTAQFAQTTGAQPTGATRDDAGPIEPEDRTLYSATGEELTASEKLKLQQKEQQNVDAALSAPGAVDITNLSELNAGFKGIVKDSEQGQVQTAAKDFIEGLTQINYETPNVNDSKDVTAEGQTGLNLIQQHTGLDPAGTSVLITSGLAAVSQELRGQQALDDPEAQDVAPEPDDADPFGALPTLEETAGGDAVRGLKVEDFRRRAAKHLKQYLVNQAVARGEDPASVQVNPDVLGALAEQTATRDNVYFKYATDKKGNKIVTLSTKGIEFSNSTNALQKATAQPVKGFRSKTPVNADTGWYNNALKEVRNQRLKKGPRDNQKRKDPTQLLNYQTVLGSAGYTTTGGQVAGTSLLAVLAQSGDVLQDTAADLLSIGPKRKATLEEKAVLGGRNPERQVKKEITASINKLNTSLRDYSNIVTSGEAEYNPHKQDPTVSRMYPENTAVEIQGNLYNRQLVNDNQNVYIKVDDKSLSRITQLEANDVWNYFARHDSDGGNTADRTMQIVEQLIVAHKNLRGKQTEKMSWQNRYNEATNPVFYNQQAAIGRNIQSAISKLGILKDDGSIDLNVLENTIPQVDPEGNVIPQAQLPEFTQEERQALNTWLNNSDKKSYGFRLSSYLALADLVNAKDTEAHWKPKQMSDMDMNSAGRSFISNDLGSESTLQYTLLLDSFLNEKGNPEVEQAGGPRSLFRKQVMDLLGDEREIYKIFQNADQAKTPNEKANLATSLLTAMQNYSNSDQKTDFEDDLGKYVQLVDDYGMPINMHQGTAASFLSNPNYSDIKDALRPYYTNENDMIIDFANIYEQALRKSGTTWQGPMVKNAVRYLQHFGEHPEFKLMYGEDSFIGSESHRDLDDDILVIRDNEGNPIPVKQKVLKKDFLGKKPAKELYDYKNNKKFDHEYDEGSLIVNQMGPILGQKRESYVLAGIANKVNPDVKKPPVWMASVHDNIVTSGRGWLKMYVAANKPGGVVDEVFDFNHTEAFVDNVSEKVDKTIIQKLSALHKKGEKLDIGRNGDYAFVMTEGDRIHEKLKGNMDAESRTHFMDMLNIYKTVGWKSPEERGDRGGVFAPKSFQVDPINWTKPVAITVNTPKGKVTKKVPAFTALSEKYNLPGHIKKFRDTKDIRNRINRRRKSERKSFIS